MKKKHCFADLYKFELLKIFKNKVAVVTFLVIFAYSFIQGEFEVRGNIDPKELKEYDTINGREIDDALLGELLEVTDEVGNVSDEGVAYREFGGWVKSIIGHGTAYRDITMDKIYAKREADILEGYQDLCLTDGELRYWEEKEANLKKPFILHDTVVMTGMLEGTTNYAIMILLIISVSLASIFAIETQRRTDPMIRASINGRKELYFAKILAGMTYVLACLVILLCTFYIYVGVAWGFRGMGESILNQFPETSLDLTGWQLTGILVVLLFFSTLLVSSFALFISNISRNSLATMAIVLGTYMVLFAVSTSIPLRMRYLSQGLSLLPSTLLSSRLVYESRLIKLGNYFLSCQVAPFLYLLLTLALIVIGYFIYEKHEIKSN